jgi:hypothetical protein
MDFFNYVMVLASVIVGLAVTHLLQGIARLIQDPDRPKLYWVHLLWVLLMFLNALFFWWWEFGLSEVGRWTFELYLFTIFFAVVLYLICAVLMPSRIGGYTDYRAYFFSRRRWLLGLVLLFSILDFADSALKGRAHLAELGWSYLASVVLRSLLLAIGMKTRSEKFHGAIVVLFTADMALLAFLNFRTMQ